MGIALLAFSSLSHPVKALTQWFARPARAAGLTASAARQRSLADNGAGHAAAAASRAPAEGLDAASPSANAASMTGVSAAAPACVVPMTKLPAATAAPAFHPLRVQSIRARLALPLVASQAANAASFHGDADGSPAGAAAAASRRSPVLRVLRRIQVADPTRLVLSGRMADVCAELDRLAASESASLTAA
ncbi:hypothetical protein [Acidovorax sp. Leaf160]|uniref:hypothetical protein n=1 Tax=Acidovorax sp. Leaf160 TaxID=1736280 RepID=UPI0012E363A2|nr:hypothetical protein [Acidovorax sp. Leaf160]